MTKHGAEKLRGRHTEVGMRYQQKVGESSRHYREVKRGAELRKGTLVVCCSFSLFSLIKRRLQHVFIQKGNPQRKRAPKPKGN